MIIVLKNADFSQSNIGTLSSWRITRSLGAGAIYNGPTSVDKDAALSAIVTLAKGYEIGTAGVTITMGGTVLSGAHSISGNVITITIAEVTGNVLIKVPTINTATGEEEEPEVPDTPDKPSKLIINIMPGSISAKLGVDSWANQGNRWCSEYIPTAWLDGTVSIVGARYIICAYDENYTYLGQLSTSGSGISIPDGGQWYESGSKVNVSAINSATFVRFIVDASNIQILINDINCFGQIVDPVFAKGSIAKETGEELNSNSTRARTTFIEVDNLAPSFTIKECNLCVCCWDATEKYIGQYDITNNVITIPTDAVWFNAGTVVSTSNLKNAGAVKVRILAENAVTGTELTSKPVLYINNIPQ